MAEQGDADEHLGRVAEKRRRHAEMEKAIDAELSAWERLFGLPGWSSDCPPDDRK